MNDLKPIEEGCLALVYNSIVPINNGKVVRVGKFLGTIEGWWGDDFWETDTEFMGCLGWGGTHMNEEKLLRIDDPNLKEEEEEESLIEDKDYV